jgi:predicted glycogen debranching enzyme
MDLPCSVWIFFPGEVGMSTKDISLPVRKLPRNASMNLENEWLVTNGLGGYSGGAVAGFPTRRYHGILVASLPPPFGRTILLNHLSERLQIDAEEAYSLSLDEWEESHVHGNEKLEIEFLFEGGLPRWIYRTPSFKLEKRIFMPYRRNVTFISYTLHEAAHPISLELRPAFHIRHHESPVDPNFNRRYETHTEKNRFTLQGPKESLQINVGFCRQEGDFDSTSAKYHSVFYPFEKARGYASVDRLFSPGLFHCLLEPGKTISLFASTEIHDCEDVELAFTAEKERRQKLLQNVAAASRFEEELILAADQFVVVPRYRDHRDHNESIIAGYHWFTDWGRDTMISLEGLTLCTGRTAETSSILKNFNQHVRDGLIPNMFPDGQQTGLYHTADATLWFFHAIARYIKYSQDQTFKKEILPTLVDIIHHHIKGTRFGIHMDPKDGLITQGAEGYQLTWMDAKVGDWVVTPRRGKAVEINALWFNALMLTQAWLKEEKSAEDFSTLIEQVKKSFNERFWNSETNSLFDVVDGEKGNDPAIRPNQIFAISLTHPVLDPSHWEAILTIVQQRLLTPMGLRSLDPQHPDYKIQYHGDLRARDAAYHQGTVWAWLIGPFIDAFLKVYPTKTQEARGFLAKFDPHLSEAGIGSISEVFDAQFPHTPRGCPAQAWSVAEVLRCLRKLNSILKE